MVEKKTRAPRKKKVITDTAEPSKYTKEKNSEQASVKVLQTPSVNERVITVENVPLRVVYEPGILSGDNLVYTVTPISEDNTYQESIPVIVNVPSGTITTPDAALKVNSVKPAKGKNKMKISTTPAQPRPKRVKKVVLLPEEEEPVEVSEQLPPTPSNNFLKSAAKTILKIVTIAVLVSMLGQPAAECNTVEQAMNVPQAHHFMVPSLNPLGVNGPLTFANMKILQTVENTASAALTASAAASVRNALESFREDQEKENEKQKMLYDILREENDRLNKIIKNNNSKMQKLVSAKSKISKTVNANQKEFLDFIEELFDENLSSDDVDDIIQDIRDAVQEKNLLIKNLSEVNNVITNQLVDLKVEKGKVEADLLRTKTELSNSNSQDSDLKRQVTILQKKVKSLSDIEKKLEDSMREIKNKHKDMRDDLEDAQRNVEKMKVVNKYELETRTRLLEEARKTHSEEVKKIQDNYEEKLKSAVRIARNEVAEALQETVSSVKEKLDLAQKNTETFFDWAAPHVRVIKQDNEYKVQYNVENIRRISPLLAEMIKDISKSFEDELNGEKSGENPRPLIDMVVRSKTMYRNKFTEFFGNLLGDSPETAKRYIMLKIGTSDSQELNPTGSQVFEYIPIDVDDIPGVREAMENAAIIQQIRTTTSITIPAGKPTPTPSANGDVELPPQVSPTTIIEQKRDTPTLIVDLPNLSPKDDARNENEDDVEEDAVNVTDERIVSKPTPSKAIVTKNSDGSTTISHTMLNICTIDADGKSTYTCSVPIFTSIADLAKEQKEDSSEVSYGENDSGDKMVYIMHKETSGCKGQGMLAQVLGATTFCVDEYINHLSDLKHRRNAKLEPPEDATEYEIAYVKGADYLPFDDKKTKISYVFGRPNKFAVEDFFLDGNNVPLTEVIGQEPFTKDAFLRLLESARLVSIDEKNNLWNERSENTEKWYKDFAKYKGFNFLEQLKSDVKKIGEISSEVAKFAWMFGYPVPDISPLTKKFSFSDNSDSNSDSSSKYIPINPHKESPTYWKPIPEREKVYVKK